MDTLLKIKLEEYLKVGIIQTIVDEELAWIKPKPTINMKEYVEGDVWNQIKKGFRDLINVSNRPNIIVLPELSVPLSYLNDLKNLTKALGAVVIAGLDFEVIDNKVKNKAVIIIPQGWPNADNCRTVTSLFFGKTFFSLEEKELFNKYFPGLKEGPEFTNYLLKAGKFGDIGVAICSDFFDIERFVIYRGKIHHLFILAFNKDINSFYFLAEAISRTVYCNVIICNTGFFGGSLAFSPFNANYKRVIYKHEGQNLFSTQVVNLPVRLIEQAHRGEDVNRVIKSCPGYKNFKK
jgi:predicted amidohydrolase